MWRSLSFMLYVCWFHLCIGFPTNRILFCVGSKRVCRGWVAVSSHVAQAGVTNSPAIMLLRLILDQGYN
jgi:hypothetical protein